MPSDEVLKSELDLFKRISYQKSIDNSVFIEYRPTSSLTESSTIEFVIPITLDEYLDLQNVFVTYRGKLVKKDESNFEAAQDGRFSLVPYGLFGIFDQISIFIGTTLISQAANTSHYMAYIDLLKEATIDKSKTFLKTSGFVSTFGQTNTDENYIDVEYSKLFEKSREFQFYGRLHGSIFDCDKLLLNGLNLRLIFNRASVQFACMGKPAVSSPSALEATEPKLKLEDISLFVRKVKVNASILSAHDKVLQTTRAIYPFRRKIIKVFNLPSNQSVFMIDNVQTGQMPARLILGIVSNNAYAGSYALNPFAFKHHSLNFLVVHLNNESFPRTPYQPKYQDDENIYFREYYDFFLNIGATKGAEQPAISYENYKNHHCLYAFNFNSDFETPDISEWISIPRSGVMNIEIRFKSNLTEALKVICFLEFDSLIEIDYHRNVLINY